jgi:hypothetical protein
LAKYSRFDWLTIIRCSFLFGNINYGATGRSLPIHLLRFGNI